MVKKGLFFMAFYSHKIRILIIYHFYGFLWLRTNPDIIYNIISNNDDEFYDM